MNAVPLRPTFPEVRCDSCGHVYTIEAATGERPVVFVEGRCPKCGHGRFSTVRDDASPVAFEWRDRHPIPETAPEGYD